jgi:hypothetical protein
MVEVHADVCLLDGHLVGLGSAQDRGGAERVTSVDGVDGVGVDLAVRTQARADLVGRAPQLDGDIASHGIGLGAVRVADEVALEVARRCLDATPRPDGRRRARPDCHAVSEAARAELAGHGVSCAKLWSAVRSSKTPVTTVRDRSHEPVDRQDRPEAILGGGTAIRP